MPRRTIDATLERRVAVELLELRGASAAAIARALGADRRTIARDLAALQVERARAVDVAPARLRLLEAARMVERSAWELYATLPPDDANGKLGALGKALAAHQQQTALLGAIEAATLAEDVAALREQVAQLVGERRPLRAVPS